MDIGRIELGRLKLPKAESLDKKAYMGNKELNELIIPEGVGYISDWAFAKCVNLRKVFVKSAPGSVRFGRGVFDGCTALRGIFFEGCDDSMPYLAAVAANGMLSGDFLIRDEEIGNSFWYSRWDLTYSNYIKKNDYDDYSNNAVCGEEDISFDGIASVDGELLGASYDYVLNVAKNKCVLIYTRLMHDLALSKGDRDISIDYIRKHAKGVDNGAAWIVLNEYFGDEVPYYEMYVDIVKPDSGALDDMIASLGDNMIQAKSYLIGIRSSGSDFFDDFSL